MATKGKTKPAKTILELPVLFRNLNVGSDTCRLGIRIDRGALTVSKADQTLCGHRLSCRIISRSSGGADQQSLPGADDDRQLEAVFDCKSFNTGRKAITAGLTASIPDIDLMILSKFPQTGGRLIVTGVEELPESKDDNGDGDDE